MTKLRTIRQQRGYTLRDVSDLSGPSVATLSRAERGLQELSPAAKVAVARALDVPVSALFAPALIDEQTQVPA